MKQLLLIPFLAIFLAACVPSKEDFIKECVAEELDRVYVFQQNRNAEQIVKYCSAEFDHRFKE